MTLESVELGLLLVAILLIILFIISLSQKETIPEIWSQKLLYNGFTPYEFEDVIAELWDSKGYNVSQSKKSQDGGVDVIASKRGTSIAMEVKQYNQDNSVGDPVVKKAMGAQQDRGKQQCYVITTSYFTKQAKETEQNNSHVRLIDGEELVSELRSSSLNPTDFEDVIRSNQK